ncbi:DUF6745 domain-containing protein [Cerasicoccus arenae]|uniref:DUF6745 domain-containing protein n=1 Tax=Cerasicoccus arenae TaxID=424488 RepID=A0A8J3GEH9_9BACT|nr:hypothetical protein [Cerasicoccus arenae]MBK1859698.1 hypothetical protein [Cerasicoccus arenae]GHC03751.1 hypothetical protein GCM10007047_20530 [Cerasicoccus arenae]
MLELSPDQAVDHILSSGQGPLKVSGKLNLSGKSFKQLPSNLECYDLDISESSIESLPSGLNVRNRIIANNCKLLTELPIGITAGSIELRNCGMLTELPEGINTWFLDLSDCPSFTNWPEYGSLRNGHLSLRNCIGLTRLPTWIERLSQLNVSGCINLPSIPEGLQVSSWVDVGGSSLMQLPQSMANVPIRWRGVPVDRRIAFEPQSLSAQEALQEDNAEVRRVIIERMGYLEFAKEAGAKVLDQDSDPGGQRQLLKIDLQEDEPLVGLSCYCPSTRRQYLLRVPPKTKSCHEAAAWIAGYDNPKDYHPNIES